PVQGSFPQWHQAAATAGVSCTALPFPSQASLLEVLPSDAIRHQQLHQFTQESPEVFQLLKPMRQIGAQASPCPAMGVGNWRHLKQAGPRCQDSGNAQLTWLIQLLLIQR
ncbi:MAG TPA: SAM-dependent methyltransferase, partial [Prochlorococcus sp.]|nr:SAM-dependent methyltransferase [Prochlorococcus sp.]